MKMCAHFARETCVIYKNDYYDTTISIAQRSENKKSPLYAIKTVTVIPPNRPQMGYRISI